MGFIEAEPSTLGAAKRNAKNLSGSFAPEQRVSVTLLVAAFSVWRLCGFA